MSQSVTRQSPLRLLTPKLLAILSGSGPSEPPHRLLETLSSVAKPSANIPDRAVNSGDADQRLLVSFWENKELDALRLRFVASIWASVSSSTFRGQCSPTNSTQNAPALGKENPNVMAELELRIRTVVLRALTTWLAVKLDDGRLSTITSQDRLFAKLLLGSARSSGIESDSRLEDALTENGQINHIEQCPACKSFIPVDGGDQAKCAKGHEWGECFNLLPGLS